MPVYSNAPARSATVTVTLCCAPFARQMQQATITAAAGTTVQQLLLQYISQSGSSADTMAHMAEQAQAGVLQCGIWNARTTPDTVLQDGDRLEIYRPLTADPKTARRERFARQGGAKTAGLFNKRRPGAKAGY